MKARDVFEILMRENAEMLLAFLRSNLSDGHVVDDLFQETMIVAWRRLDDFDQERSFGKWLRGIASNLMLAHFRKLGKAEVAVEQETLDWLETRFAKIQSLKGDSFADKLDLLRECVAALPEKYQTTIQARYHQQLSLEQMVDQLRVALETIKKRLYRAKSQLGQCMEKKLLAIEVG